MHCVFCKPLNTSINAFMNFIIIKWQESNYKLLMEYILWGPTILLMI